MLAVAAGFVLKFFKYCVDFNRTENVQFEDDDYYYYVKAVPKYSSYADDEEEEEDEYEEEDDDYYYYVKAVPKVTVSDSLRTVKTFSTSETAGAGFRDQAGRKSGNKEKESEA